MSLLVLSRIDAINFPSEYVSLLKRNAKNYFAVSPHNNIMDDIKYKGKYPQQRHVEIILEQIETKEYTYFASTRQNNIITNYNITIQHKIDLFLIPNNT